MFTRSHAVIAELYLGLDIQNQRGYTAYTSWMRAAVFGVSTAWQATPCCPASVRGREGPPSARPVAIELQKLQHTHLDVQS